MLAYKPAGTVLPTLTCVHISWDLVKKWILVHQAVGVFCSVLSRVWLFATPWTVAQQAPLSMGFPRQEYWSGLPSPAPGDLPDPGVGPAAPVSCTGRQTLAVVPED